MTLHVVLQRNVDFFKHLVKACPRSMISSGMREKSLILVGPRDCNSKCFKEDKSQRDQNQNLLLPQPASWLPHKERERWLCWPGQQLKKKNILWKWRKAQVECSTGENWDEVTEKSLEHPQMRLWSLMVLHHWNICTDVLFWSWLCKEVTQVHTSWWVAAFKPGMESILPEAHPRQSPASEAGAGATGCFFSQRPIFFNLFKQQPRRRLSSCNPEIRFI